MVRGLFVAFGTVVGLAQHLAVVNRGGSAAAPCGDMVGIHLRDAVYGEVTPFGVVAGQKYCFAPKYVGVILDIGVHLHLNIMELGV